MGVAQRNFMECDSLGFAALSLTVQQSLVISRISFSSNREVHARLTRVKLVRYLVTIL